MSTFRNDTDYKGTNSVQWLIIQLLYNLWKSVQLCSRSVKKVAGFLTSIDLCTSQKKFACSISMNMQNVGAINTDWTCTCLFKTSDLSDYNAHIIWTIRVISKVYFFYHTPLYSFTLQTKVLKRGQNTFFAVYPPQVPWARREFSITTIPDFVAKKHLPHPFYRQKNSFGPHVKHFEHTMERQVISYSKTFDFQTSLHFDCPRFSGILLPSLTRHCAQVIFGIFLPKQFSGQWSQTVHHHFGYPRTDTLLTEIIQMMLKYVSSSWCWKKPLLTREYITY